MSATDGGAPGRERACQNPDCRRVFTPPPGHRWGHVSPYCAQTCAYRAARLRKKARDLAAGKAPRVLSARACIREGCGRRFVPRQANVVTCSESCRRAVDHANDLDRRAGYAVGRAARVARLAARPLPARCPGCQRGRVVRDDVTPLLAYCARRCGWFDLPTRRGRQVLEVDPAEDGDDG